MSGRGFAVRGESAPVHLVAKDRGLVGRGAPTCHAFELECQFVVGEPLGHTGEVLTAFKGFEAGAHSEREDCRRVPAGANLVAEAIADLLFYVQRGVDAPFVLDEELAAGPSVRANQSWVLAVVEPDRAIDGRINKPARALVGGTVRRGRLRRQHPGPLPAVASTDMPPIKKKHVQRRERATGGLSTQPPLENRAPSCFQEVPLAATA